MFMSADSAEHINNWGHDVASQESLDCSQIDIQVYDPAWLRDLENTFRPDTGE